MEALNAAFIHVLQQVQEAYVVLDKRLQVRVERWVTKLAEESANATFCRNRNEHAVALLLAVESGEFEEPFDKIPSDAPLGNLPPALMLRVRGMMRRQSANQAPVVPGMPRRRKGTLGAKISVWNAAIASTKLNMKPDAPSPEVVPRPSAPQSSDIMQKVTEGKQRASRWMGRHSGCFSAPACASSSLSPCRCHCSLDRSKREKFGTGTLAVFPLRDGSTDGGANLTNGRHFGRGRPSSRGGASVSHAFTRSGQRKSASRSRSRSSSHPTGRRFAGKENELFPARHEWTMGLDAGTYGESLHHEDVAGKPVERRARRVSSLLRQLSAPREARSASPPENDQGADGHLVSAAPFPMLHAPAPAMPTPFGSDDVDPAVAGRVVKESAVRRAMQQVELGQARLEAVAAKTAEATAHRAMAAVEGMNEKLNKVLADMHSCVDTLNKKHPLTFFPRSESRPNVSAPPVPPAAPATKVGTRGPVSLMSSDLGSFAVQSPVATSTRPRIAAVPPEVPTHSQSRSHARSSGPSRRQGRQPPVPVTVQLCGGDEIDIEAAKYGPSPAGRVLSPTREKVSPISVSSTSAVDLPAFARKDSLRASSRKTQQSKKSVVHALRRALEEEGIDLSAMHSSGRLQARGDVSAARSAVHLSRTTTDESGMESFLEFGQVSECDLDADDKVLRPAAGHTVRETAAHAVTPSVLPHAPLARPIHSALDALHREVLSSVPQHDLSRLNPSWNIPIVPLVIPHGVASMTQRGIPLAAGTR